MSDLVLILAAVTFPYVWGELTCWIMQRILPRGDRPDAAESATSRDVLDFQI